MIIEIREKGSKRGFTKIMANISSGRIFGRIPCGKLPDISFSG